MTSEIYKDYDTANVWCQLLLVDTMSVCLLFLLITAGLCGRSTNRFYSLADGGYHHHGGFLLGYYNFFRGDINNSQDSFSRKYEKDDGGDPLTTHNNLLIREPVLQEVDPRLLIQIPTGRNSSTFFLNRLLNKIP